MDVSHITTQQIVYEPVDVPSSVSKSGLKYLSRLWFLAYPSSLKNWALGSRECIYTYLGGTHWISEASSPWLSQGNTGAILARCDVRSRVSWLSQGGGGAPVHLFLQCIWGFCALLFDYKGSHLFDFPEPSPGVCPLLPSQCYALNLHLPIISFLTSAQGLFMSHCVCSIVARENPPFAILAIVQTRRMSHCSSCTQPPSIAIVADMSKTRMKLVTAFTYEIWLLYKQWLKSILSTLGNNYR